MQLPSECLEKLASDYTLNKDSFEDLKKFSDTNWFELH